MKFFILLRKSEVLQTRSGSLAVTLGCLWEEKDSSWRRAHKSLRGNKCSQSVVFKEDKMAEYKGAAKEGARAMALMKKREKMKADIEAAKNKISEVCFVTHSMLR